MKSYLDMLGHVMQNGVVKGDRTGVGTHSVFGYQFRHNLEEGFPLLTTKRMHWKSIVYELLWFISGSNNVQFLRDNGVTIWDEWADDKGDLGPVYGTQWRSWLGYSFDDYGAEEKFEIDQLSQVIDRIRTVPECRRLIVTAWNPAEVSQMALPPCHLLFQFYASEGRLSCHMYQRSADIFLGVPFNIASYALLTHMVAHVTNHRPGDLIISFGDLHLYRNHIQQAWTQLERDPFPLPELELNPEIADIDHFTYDDISLLHYNCHSKIKAPIAV